MRVSDLSVLTLAGAAAALLILRARRAKRLLKTSTAQDSATKLNVICLHGLAGNAKSCERAFGHLRARCAKIANFSFVESPHEFRENFTNLDYEHLRAENLSAETRTWFDPTKSNEKWGFPESVAQVSKFADHIGGVHVLLGYSQGGLFLASTIAYKEEMFPKLMGAVFVHADDFHYTPPGMNLTNLGSVKTLHIIGDNDKTVAPSRSSNLCGRFASHEAVHHPGGHGPNDIPLERIHSFLASLREQLLEC